MGVIDDERDGFSISKKSTTPNFLKSNHTTKSSTKTSSKSSNSTTKTFFKRIKAKFRLSTNDNNNIDGDAEEENFGDGPKDGFKKGENQFKRNKDGDVAGTCVSSVLLEL